MDNDVLWNWPSDVRTVLVNFGAGRIPHDLTSSSTNTNVFQVIAENDVGAKRTIFVSGYDDTADIGRQLMTVKSEGYKIVPETARISCSIHQNHLDKAKAILIKEILPYDLPSPANMADMIASCGVALNRQIDCDPRIFGKPQFKSPDLSKKLLELGLNRGQMQRLYDKYVDLHPYYNSSRHFQRIENEKALSKLNSKQGKVICIDFFETTRRIFRWYYRKAIPNWDVLKPIKFSEYRVRYAFRYDRRFPL